MFISFSSAHRTLVNHYYEYISFPSHNEVVVGKESIQVGIVCLFIRSQSDCTSHNLSIGTLILALILFLSVVSLSQIFANNNV